MDSNEIKCIKVFQSRVVSDFYLYVWCFINIKGIIHPRIKIGCFIFIPSFTHSKVVLNPSSAKHKRYFEENVVTGPQCSLLSKSMWTSNCLVIHLLQNILLLMWMFVALYSILRVERVLYIQSPHLQSLPAQDSNSQPLDYESDSLTIRPRLP